MGYLREWDRLEVIRYLRKKSEDDQKNEEILYWQEFYR